MLRNGQEIEYPRTCFYLRFSRLIHLVSCTYHATIGVLLLTFRYRNNINEFLLQAQGLPQAAAALSSSALSIGGDSQSQLKESNIHELRSQLDTMQKELKSLQEKVTKLEKLLEKKVSSIIGMLLQTFESRPQARTFGMGRGCSLSEK